jgi:hypothetical protein
MPDGASELCLDNVLTYIIQGRTKISRGGLSDPLSEPVRMILIGPVRTTLLESIRTLCQNAVF